MKISTKRLFAYIIDMAIVFIISFLISALFPSNNYNVELSNLQQLYFENKIDKASFISQYQILLHNTDKQDLGFNIINLIIIMIFFVIIPYFTKGKTIGMYLMKIEIKKDNLGFDELIGRSIINNGLGYLIFMFAILYFTNDNIYFILINIFAFFQILVVIISGFMVLYNEKHLGIADILTKTRIEEIS